MKNKSNNSILKRILAIIVFLIIISLFNNKSSDKNDKTYDTTTNYDTAKSYNTTSYNNYSNNIWWTNDLTDDMKKRWSVFCLWEAYAIVEIESLNMSTQWLLNDKMSDTIVEVWESTYNLCINNLWWKESYSKKINEKNYTLWQVAFCMWFKSWWKDLAAATYYQILQMWWDVSNYNPNENWDDYYYKCLDNKIWENVIPPVENTNNTKNCNIKWNVWFNNWKKIYHLPWCSHYNDTIINREYWERYFCSEQEAINAWRRKCIDY